MADNDLERLMEAREWLLQQPDCESCEGSGEAVVMLSYTNRATITERCYSCKGSGKKESFLSLLTRYGAKCRAEQKAIMFSIDRKKVEALSAASSNKFRVQSYEQMHQPPITAEEPASIYGVTYSVPPNLDNARKHLIALRERLGDNLLNEEQLRERLESIRGSG